MASKMFLKFVVVVFMEIFSSIFIAARPNCTVVEFDRDAIELSDINDE